MKRSSKKKSSASSILLLTLMMVILLFVLVRFLAHQATPPPAPSPEGPATPLENTDRLELPAPKAGEQIIRHKGYTLSYNELYEQANWVAYKLTKQQKLFSANFPRTDKFIADPLVKTGSAGSEDYEGSGYDRGHLAPAEDMDWSKTSMAESFYYSNMSPQKPAFNRGVWRRLEELVRYWAIAYDSIYIVTGPVLTRGLPVIGPDKVAVPAYYFKAILEYRNRDVKAIGFVLPNEASAASLKSFAVSVDSVEKLTGLDLFPALPDEVENKVEAEVNPKDWLWTRKRP